MWEFNKASTREGDAAAQESGKEPLGSKALKAELVEDSNAYASIAV